MMASDDMIEARLREAEPYVIHFARRLRLESVGMDFDDSAQLLRIDVWQSIDHYDHSVAKWTTFVFGVLRLRSIDIMRRHGVKGRYGKVRASHQSMWSIDALVDHIDFIEPRPFGATDIDWTDFVEFMSEQSKPFRAVVQMAQGMTRGESGAELGVGDSRISHMLSEIKQSHESKARLLYLLGR